VLSVPWAVDSTGRLVTPAEVTSRTGLRCPDPACGSRLSLHAGAVVVHHFAHLDQERCSFESVQHWAAKHLLATVVRAAVSDSGKRPLIHRRCPTCWKTFQHPLPQSVRGVQVEAALDGLRPDVLLVDGAGQPLCAVEVLHTHAVSWEKAQRLRVPWIELAADEVLSDPLLWRPRTEGLRPLVCDHREGERDPRDRPAPTAGIRGREERRNAAWEMRSNWCPFPLSPGEYLAEITDISDQWWPLEPWRCVSMGEAIESAERKLRTFRELCLYLQPNSTIRVAIRAWDGTTVTGGWLRGRWVVRPSEDGEAALSLRAERAQGARRYWRARRRWI
jgi:hypothetical protein